MKKVGKTTRPYTYDLKLSLTVEVTNRFKGLDLIDRVPEELWTEVHDIVQKAVTNPNSKKKKFKKAKWLSEEALQIAEKRRGAKGKGEKEIPTSNNTREDSTRGHHQMVDTKMRLIIFFAAEDGETLYSQQKHDQELTGSDHEIFIAKLRLKLKKVGKTTRPFRYT